MSAPTPNSERATTLPADYNPLEYSAEYKLLYLQELVAKEASKEIVEFLAKQSEYEIANLLESFPIQDRHLIWAQVPEELEGLGFGARAPRVVLLRHLPSLLTVCC